MRAAAGWTVSMLALGVASPALANLDGRPVTVQLNDPSESIFAETQVVVGAGPEITPGDGSEVGAELLATESVELTNASIVVTLEEGAADGATGFGPGANLVFLGLRGGVPPMELTDVAVVLTKVSGVALGTEVFFDADTLTLFVDTPTLDDQPGLIDTGSVELQLTLPEPAGGAFAALAVLAALARRRAARSC